MGRKAKTVVHEFYCTQCGERGIPVHRKPNQFREAGHLKKLYCLNCAKEINHVECVSGSKYDLDMFLKEYASGNFDEQGNRVLSLSEWKQAYYQVNVDETVPQEEDMTEWYELFHIAVEA